MTAGKLLGLQGLFVLCLWCNRQDYLCGWEGWGVWNVPEKPLAHRLAQVGPMKISMRTQQCQGVTHATQHTTSSDQHHQALHFPQQQGDHVLWQKLRKLLVCKPTHFSLWLSHFDKNEDKMQSFAELGEFGVRVECDLPRTTTCVGIMS